IKMIVYLNGHFVAKEDAKISPDDRGFLFADGAYEVIRSYAGELFEPAAHLDRLRRSLNELRITGAPDADLPAVIGEVIRRNPAHSGDCTVYIQITRGTAARCHSFPDRETSPTVYISVAPFQSQDEKAAQGAKIILVPDIRWGRCDIKTVALLPNILASQTAKERGADEAVFVRDGYITEGTHTNFCGIFSQRLVTHPLDNHILDGITRRVVLDLCHDMRIPVEETPIHENDLKNAAELLLMCTTLEVMPVVQVDGRPVADGVAGPVTRALQKAFRRRINM
ncbi:MAG: aminotransferase class IV, partial [Candidatus Latescibacterota bacterium]